MLSSCLSEFTAAAPVSSQSPKTHQLPQQDVSTLNSFKLQLQDQALHFSLHVYKAIHFQLPQHFEFGF